MPVFLSLMLGLVSISARADEIPEYENPRETWKTFFRNYYSKPDFVKNRVYLDLSTGLALPDAKITNISKKFAKTYPIEFRYGFIRQNYETGVPGMFRHERDYFLLGNISSTFKSFTPDYSFLNTHIWRFGPGIENGFGYYKADGRPGLLLKHNSSLIWTHIDFDGTGNLGDEKYIKYFDEKIKFGSIWSGGIDYTINDYVAVSVDFEQAMIIPDFRFGVWTASFILDNAIQKWPDFFEPDLMPLMGKKWGFVKFLYKNFASFVLYSVRAEDVWAPFPAEGPEPIMIRSYKVGVSISI